MSPLHRLRLVPPFGPQDMEKSHSDIFFAAVTTTRLPMVVTDPNQADNPIIFVNDAFLQMTGYARQEVIGRNCRFLQGCDTKLETAVQIRESLHNRIETSIEILNYKKDGTPFWNALYISPIYDANGKLLYFFSSQLDVTHRRVSEQEILEKRRMDAIGQLTGGIAHDFNNLLTVIQGFAELIQSTIDRDSFDLARVKRSLSAILTATEKGSKLTSQLLAFSSKQKLDAQNVCPKELVDTSLMGISQLVGPNISLNVTHDDDSGVVHIDPEQAKSALTNVIANACDAMSGKGVVSITVRHYDIRDDNSIFGSIERGHYTAISVADTGSGMEGETLERVTEPFFTTKSEGKGTGLGMSMVYGFMKQSGGFLKIQSVWGKGTTVHMLFRRNPDGAENVPERSIASSGIPTSEGGVVLVVEDRSDVAQLAKEVLTQSGYSVLLAENADKALDTLRADTSIKLLFSDIVMPGSMNGVQLAQTVSKHNPNLKVLLATGYTDAAVDLVDTKGQPFPLIRKPYRSADLISKIQSMFS